ncbi:uncharacterized protein KY384_005063 [Bacidia gigantensis]|uniref:uncharacterized protein n=1 Tax=Bacidia gigantensis TaxID=2732470 RepID=UPI001D044629|nr:uncharacterized protein KY384_005063 [Bacidia gigantensis]KAG8530560.1 hypothetical protein KY384_005063 [Bacidia gigantensis]
MGVDESKSSATAAVEPVEGVARRGGVSKFLSGLKSRAQEEKSTFAAGAGTQVNTQSDDGESLRSLKETELGVNTEHGLEQYYVPIDTYEGRHRYDPKATWTPDEEKALIRKLDFRVCAYVCFMFFALQLDRGNISQALSDNLLKDLHMNTNDYNTGQTIFYVSFLAAELPSQLVSKKIGPDNWIPIQMISWSIVASCQSRLSGRATFFFCRSLLGIIEGGFIPDVILYLSYFYKSKELPIRLSFFWGAYAMTYIISAFLAYGILHLRGHNGMAGWQWLFALEGALTAAIGILSWQAVTPRLLWEALKDYDMWPIYLLGLTWTTANQCANAYITLILRSLKFDTFETNLLTVPAYVLFILQLIFWTWFSEKINNRYIIILMCQFWILPLVVSLKTLPGGPAYAWSRYVLILMLVGFPYVHAIIGEPSNAYTYIKANSSRVVAMTSRNAGSVRTRTVGSALYNMCVQASNIISSNVRAISFSRRTNLTALRCVKDPADSGGNGRSTVIKTSPSIGPEMQSSLAFAATT